MVAYLGNPLAFFRPLHGSPGGLDNPPRQMFPLAGSCQLSCGQTGPSPDPNVPTRPPPVPSHRTRSPSLQPGLVLDQLPRPRDAARQPPQRGTAVSFPRG